MKFLRTGIIALSAVALTSSIASADVKVTIQNGRVSIVAKDATVRQILTEWARVGQTKVVNVERIPGGPQTIELTNVPEAEALDVLLRSVSGFIAAPRAVSAGLNASQFERIVVMPTSAAPRPPVSAAAAPMPTPTMMPQPMPAPTDDDVDDERPQPPVAMPPGVPRGPIFNQFPPPQIVNPQGAPAAMPQPFNQAQPQVGQPQSQQPAAVPTAPFGGVAVPGMIAPAPQQPGQQPNQPGQPVRRPNGDGREGA
ncbi:MAG TPA: hypothetical protein VFB07_07990 [Vicinamibacterales bacterium]|nr:hypothetical protein [Vicinamibacterales bacterium]